MTLLKFDTNLTRGSVDHLAAKTHIGMAHFAGTGPAGVSCRECIHWASKRDYYARGGKHGPTLKPSPCIRFGRGREPVPHHAAAACKYFEPNPAAPNIEDRR